MVLRHRYSDSICDFTSQFRWRTSFYDDSGEQSYCDHFVDFDAACGVLVVPLRE